MTCRTPFHALLGGVLPISSRAFRRGATALVVIALLVVISASAGCLLLADWWTTLPVGSQAEFVGRDSCMKCHQPQAQSWHGSHHDLAMDHARTDTVLGDFDNAQFEYQGVTSTMFQREGRYFVNTEGPDGELQDFEVKYVLGV